MQYKEDYIFYVYPSYVTYLQEGDQVIVWRKSWPEREANHCKDCEAEVLDIPTRIHKQQLI
jgi:hypothetical protein